MGQERRLRCRDGETTTDLGGQAGDALAGKFRALVQQHVPGDSLFVYTTDHGAQWPFAKWNLYDAGTLKAGSTQEAMICLPDLVPTFIELAGGQVLSDPGGKSFAGVLRSKTKRHRDRDFNVYPIRSLRTRRWKYILNLHPEFQHQTHDSRNRRGNGVQYWKSWVEEATTNPAAAAIVNRSVERPAEELYDLQADPHEMQNLAGDPKQASRVASMRAELKAWMKQQGDTETVFGKPLRLGEPVTLLPPVA